MLVGFARSRERQLPFEDGCDEFLGRRGSYFRDPVASDPTRIGSGESTRVDEGS
jgi:hypothetical protein